MRLDEAEACALVLVGVQAGGSNELIAMDAGYRESGESWAGLLRDCARRGMGPASGGRRRDAGVLEGAARGLPRIAGTGWVHKTANVRDALPKSAHPAAETAIAEI